MLPPKLVRRLVLAPLMVALSAALVVLFPLLGVALAAFSLARSGRLRAFRVLCFATIWLLAETAALFMLLGLWIASGRLGDEPYLEANYAVMRWFLDVLYRAAERTFALRVSVSGPGGCVPGRPLIVLSRHAGPGDSLLLAHQLLAVFERRPRVVMKAAIQLDPGIDVVGNRLPNVFVQHRAGERSSAQVARLAASLEGQDALVIFPEGGNWTPTRWRRGIRRLEARGRHDLASRARRMPNVLPPRPGGTLAAISGCPAADVIFVAHTWLDRLVTVRDVWRHLPVEQALVARWWRVPADQVPRQAPHEDQVQWVYDWWERLDSWITENRPPAQPRTAR